MARVITWCLLHSAAARYLTGVLFVADAGLQRLRRQESPGKAG